MAAFASRIHALERELSGVLHPRDTPTASTSSATPSYTGTPGVNGHLSTSVKTLAGFFTVVGLLVIAIVAWKVYTCRKRKATRAPSSQINISIAEKGLSEKQAFHLDLTDDDVKDIKAPNKATLLPAVPQTPSVGWVPQVRTVYQPGPLAPLPSAVKPPSRSPRNNATSVQPNQEELGRRSPPPNYRTATTTSLPPPPPPPSTALPSVPPPPTPPASRKQSPPPSLVIPRDTFDLPPVPVVSPRTTSMGQPKTPTVRTPKSAISSLFSVKSSSSLPRLMDVASTFTPSREDELAVRVGEVLRLLEEFEDEWCLVQRVGPVDAEKGVIPRFCLQERRRTAPHRRFTNHVFSIQGRK
ncbi:hypothetical protein DENSPDRAFT_878753 [Dentipellis sp. KUC8613]|nr:hypothetical protein DENSPDRAFT_878753 [Dentipellis sp. KUC8613]